MALNLHALEVYFLMNSSPLDAVDEVGKQYLDANVAYRKAC